MAWKNMDLFIYLPLTLTLNNWDYIESNNWMEEINEMERKWKKVIVA